MNVCMNCLQADAIQTYPTLFTGDQCLCQDCIDHSVIVARPRDGQLLLYCPQPHQQIAHASNASNLLELGTRGTGKSTWMRWDAILRCLIYPGFKVLFLRREIGDLRKSHLQFIGVEMDLLEAGKYRETTFDCKFDNGSLIQFSHCEKISDVSNYLGSQWDLICFDEVSTFTLDMFLLISAAARTVVGRGFKALVHCCSNPAGIGAEWMKQWFIDHNVDRAKFPDYDPLDYDYHFSTLDQNRFVSREDYEKRLRNVPEGIRRAWLYGEFVIEGAYFTDFQREKKIITSTGIERSVPWHIIKSVPTVQDEFGERVAASRANWIRVLRSLDWGYNPDPAVCHWHLLLPNNQRITFMERTWERTLAATVAKDIKQLSLGMKITETWSDPTMFVKTGNSPFSIADVFENNGVPLTQAQNDRALYGYALHEGLNTLVHALVDCGFPDCNEHTCPEHWVPRWQIVESACPELIRTLPILQMDKTDQSKIADGPDHWAISCAYAWMSDAAASRRPEARQGLKPWMLPRHLRRQALLVQ